MRWLVGIGCAAALLATACGGRHTATPARAPATRQVTELRSIEQLRAAFNAQSGVPRLIVLVSPT